MNERLIIPIEYNTYCIEYYSTKSSFINFFVKKKDNSFKTTSWF
jgi:hypothetical protein